MKEKIQNYFKALPEKIKQYFKTLNYPFYISMILVAIGLFLTDYFSKHAAFNFLTDGNTSNPTVLSDRVGTVIIPGILNLTFTANSGAAWGSFSGKMWALCIVSLIASIALTFNILFRFNKYNLWMTIGMTLMAPGAIGNLVDRLGCLSQSGIYKHGVIDFLQFTFWPSFPICNLADYYLTIGVVVLLIGFVIEFKKEYKEMKEEEAREKAAEANPSFIVGDSDDEMKKKLADMENKEEKKETETKTDEVKDESNGK